MKTFSTIFMIIAVIAGFVLAVTPFVAEKFFPAPKNVVRQAKPDAAAMALKQWFNSPDAQFINVQAINKESPEAKTAWFSFSVGRRPVETYILDKKLVQKELSNDILTHIFYEKNRPASWWQPAALNQQTYFTGIDQGRQVSLIYSPETKRGVLVTTTAISNPPKK